MKVLLFAPYFPPAHRGGGPIRTLAALTRTAPRTVELSIITRDRDLGADVPLPVERNAWLALEGSGNRIRYTSFDRLPALVRAYWSSRGDTDVVYLNGFFDPQASILPVLLHRLRLWGGACLLVAPRGEFSAGALAIKPNRKRAFIRLFRWVVSRNLVWHASTPSEALDIAAVVGSDATIVVREDETDLPPDALPYVSRPRTSPDVLRLVFVSRISPMKGLTLLLEALSNVTTEVALDIYGPEEDAREVAAARSLAGSLPANVTCRFVGQLAPEEVRGVFADYDLFTFPTAGENFGHVVVEALSASCPVMISDTTPWTDTIRGGGGVVVTPREPAEWTRAIERYAAAGPAAWEAARHSATEAYRGWAEAPKGAHVFDLVPTS